MPVLIWLLALAVFAQGTSEFVFSGLLAGISTDLDVPVGTAGLLTSAFAVGMVTGAPAMAVLGRRFPPRLALTGFLLVFILAHVVGALSPAFSVLLATRVFAALANAGFLAVALSTVTRVVPVERQSAAVSVILGSTTLALIAGVPGGALLGTLGGWRSTLWAIVAVSVPPLVAVYLGVRPQHDNPGHIADGDTPPDLHSELSVLFAPQVLRPAFLGLLVNAATFCGFTYLAVTGIDRAGVSEDATAGLLALFGVGAFLGVTIAGRIQEQHRDMLMSVVTPLLLTSWVAATVGGDSPVLWWLLSPVLGLLSFSLGSSLIMRTIAKASGAPTLNGACATTAMNLGALGGPVLGGIALSSLGLAGPTMVSAGFILFAAVALCAGPRG